MAERALRACFQAALWLPLSVCTWLALMPAPPGALSQVSDVILHGGAFVYLTVAARQAFPGSPWWVLGCWMLGYGAVLEGLQSLGDTRVAEWRDLAIDALGIALGFGVDRLVGARARRLLARVLDGRVR